jgi:pimeloyl-ACP methyl ester carboxylesterase
VTWARGSVQPDAASSHMTGEDSGGVPPAGGRFRHVDDLLAVLDAVTPKAPAWLVGSSMGGAVALHAALQAPERVAGLVLFAPAVSGDPDPDEEPYNAATDGLAAAIDAAWRAGDLEACNRLEVRLWLDGPAGPEGRVSAQARELALDMNRLVIGQRRVGCRRCQRSRCGKPRARVAVPTLVACGDLDERPSPLSLCMKSRSASAGALGPTPSSCRTDRGAPLALVASSTSRLRSSSRVGGSERDQGRARVPPPEV